MSLVDCNARTDVLTEWMNIIDTSSISSSSPKTPRKFLVDDEWVSLPEKLSISRHSSYGAVFETDAILNLLGIQKSGSTNSIGITELWEINAMKETEVTGTQTNDNSSSEKDIISTENKPEIIQSRKWDLFKWCLPKRMSKPTTCPATNLNKPNKLNLLLCASPETPVVKQAQSNLMLNECFDIDEEEEEDGDDDDDGYIDPNFLLATSLTKTY